MNSVFYIYVYLDTRREGRYCYDDFCFTYEPFYVGKGKNKRDKNLLQRSDYFKNKVRKIKAERLEPLVIRLYENLNEQQAFETEKHLIEEIGRRDEGTGLLVNETEGGEGVVGYKHTEETLSKRRVNFLDIEEEFKRRDYKLLTEKEEYKSNLTKLDYICSKGHKGSITWGNFRYGQQNCPYCKKVKVNFLDIEEEFKRKGCKLLTREDEYKKNLTRLNYICLKGHKSFTTWAKFRRGYGCALCDRERKRKASSKLSEQQVIQIKALLKQDKSQREIAELFSVDPTTVSCIKRGKTWLHLTEEIQK